MVSVIDPHEVKLSQAQRKFTRLIAQLIVWTYDQGWELTFGEVMRTVQQAQWNAEHHVGSAHSVHMESLAVDFHLFIADQYQTDSAKYAPMGAYWKTLDPLCRWGGDFHAPSPVDGNHFSFAWQGRA